jgi:retinol dehydrogenase 12
LEEIKGRSKATKVHLMELDLASIQSIRKFSKQFHEREDKLDILVNNAGVMACPRSLTEDGFEMQIGVNHLGHFLLTNLLLDLLKAGAPSRVVVVSSEAHRMYDINKDDLMSEHSYSRFRAYSQSKLANILFTRELAKRLSGTGITVNCCHPGERFKFI